LQRRGGNGQRSRSSCLPAGGHQADRRDRCRSTNRPRGNGGSAGADRTRKRNRQRLGLARKTVEAVTMASAPASFSQRRRPPQWAASTLWLFQEAGGVKPMRHVRYLIQRRPFVDPARRRRVPERPRGPGVRVLLPGFLDANAGVKWEAPPPLSTRSPGKYAGKIDATSSPSATAHDKIFPSLVASPC